MRIRQGRAGGGWGGQGRDEGALGMIVCALLVCFSSRLTSLPEHRLEAVQRPTLGTWHGRRLHIRGPNPRI